jgi:hypothetical protein
MPSILLLAIGVGVAAILLGSVALQFLTPTNDFEISPLEKNCQQIANEGYKMHTLYPDSNLDELPERDRNQLKYLDDLWIKECVSALPADILFKIINNVERDFLHGE